MLFYIVISIIFLPCTILFPVIIKGKKNLKKLKKQNYIISCNHMSNLDPVMVDVRLKKKYYILAKKELFKNKFFGACMRGFGAVSVDRQGTDTKAIRQIFSLIQKKKNICIFPQGTRCKTPIIEDGAAKEGVAMFSIRTNTPVVPMVFNKKIRIFRWTKLIIGEPIYPDETRKKDKEYLEEYSQLIITKMNELLKGDK